MFGKLLDGLHQRVAQQVGERDLAAASAFELVVDHDPVVDHQLGRDGPDAGRRRHVQRRRHVLDDGRGGAAQHLHLVAFGGRGAGRLGCGRRCGAARPGCWPRRCRTRRAGGGAARLRRAPVWRRGGSLRRGFASAGVVARRARGCSRPGTHASSDRPRRGRRGTCGTSPRPAIRSARMVNSYCSRPLLASIPLSFQGAAPRLPLDPAAPGCRGASHTCGGPAEASAS